jgi:hypothetical protein
MTIHSEIDETLRRLGSVEPPPGLKRRIDLRLQTPRSRFSSSMIQTMAACGLAASVALSAVALNPTLRNLVFHHHSSAQAAPAANNTPRVVPAAPGGFGTASAVHVPVEPVPVQPTPVNQGRGRSRSDPRSGRALLPNGAPLPRGVAVPHTPPSVAPDSAH